MDMTLTRTAFAEDGILSDLKDANNKMVAYTLEHSYDNLPKIPDGTYTCIRGWHQLHSGPPFQTFEITGVPGHTKLLFHVGNWNKDSEGCVLLGEAIVQSHQGVMITNSKAVFNEFMVIQSRVDSFTLTVVS